MLKIGEFSSLARISIRMLRRYDEVGLLHPEIVDAATGYRYYDEAQLAAASTVVALRDMGFGVAEIGEWMHGAVKPDWQHVRLLARREAILQQIEQLREQNARVETALQRIGKEHTHMNYNVSLKELPARHVASVRDILPSYNEEGRLWHYMMKETAPLNMRQADPCNTLGIYHDEGYKEKDVDVEIQMDVIGQYPDTEHVKFKDVAPIVMASATYQGSYAQIDAVNAAVAAWVRDNGYVFDGKSFSIYHVSPHETQNPDELVTEVCYPVRKQ